MFKVIIAEDEMFVRIGIKNSIEWSKFALEVVDDVADGLQAWESYQSHNPDLIITDIRMPQMDGIELISKIRDQDKETKIVILSNIEDFKLAQKAMALGVSGYILKLTMTWDEIDGILGKIAQELEERNVTDIGQTDRNEGKSLLKTRIFADCYAGQLLSVDYIEGVVEKKKLRLGSQKLVLCMLEIDRYEEQGGSPGLLSAPGAIVNLLSEILDGYARGEVVYYTDKNYALLFSFGDLAATDEINDALHKILDRVQKLTEDYFDLPVTVAISSIRDGYQDVGTLFEECSEAMHGKFYAGRGSYLRFDRERNENRFERYVQPVFHEAIEQFLRLFGEEYRKEFGLDLSELRTNVSIDAVKRAYLVLLQFPLTILKVIRQDLFLLQGSYAQRILGCETLRDISELFSQFLWEISEVIGKKAAFSREMQLSLQYIRENYQHEIALKQVAAFVNLSSSYLSTVFKNEMNINFVDYLAQYRIEKSKEMLLGSDMKLYEISDKVGFRDVSYFCRIFKKITGYRPNEFKRKFVYQDRH